MKWILPLEDLPAASPADIGGKGAALHRLMTGGDSIPPTVCITARAYADFVDHAGLREKIHLELHRKHFAEMRWEEVWDASQRLRLLFLKSPLPPAMADAMTEVLAGAFGDTATCVRSSAPEEDGSGHSFAGLHQSYTHIHGPAAIIRHIRLVWASLWSDAALLYRQELKLDTVASSMAVLVQHLIPGQVSGILFTQNPNSPEEGVVEAVHGLNPPLVDGKISPDRWIIAADSGAITAHTAPASRDQWQPPGDAAAKERLSPLPADLRERAPLDADQLSTLWGTGKRLAAQAGAPQDIEWTFADGDLVLLQARPITARPVAAADDNRAWYLSLHRSLENLLTLQRRIEDELVPQMRSAAAELDAAPLTDLSDAGLVAEIRRRWEINQYWAKVYWDDFIPFAHGMRLFGQVYNEVMVPEDPYVFMNLLKHQDLLSLQRNRALARLAEGVRRHPQRQNALAGNDLKGLDPDFRRDLDDFIQRYGDLSCTVTGAVDCAPDAGTLPNMILEMAKLPITPVTDEKAAEATRLEAEFLQSCPVNMADTCRDLLSVARASYRLRDDDNIILGAIEAQLIAAAQEGRRRAAAGNHIISPVLSELGLEKPTQSNPHRTDAPPAAVRDRQITGQPAGPGLARGKARVIRQHTDIAGFKKGEIIVCDGVDPNMTFVMPLAAGIIERRGGMLIHGAIIAREYGLPCVTGVVDATGRIQTGQEVTVDGYLGLVTLGEVNAASTQGKD